jgi:addiction module HigA family antidote
MTLFGKTARSTTCAVVSPKTITALGERAEIDKCKATGHTLFMKTPPHPGDFIKTEIIEAAGLTVTAAAAALGVSRPTLSSLLNSKAGLSGEMALRIEKAFGVKMDTLMRMQSAYEIAQTRKREGEIRVRRVRVAA